MARTREVKGDVDEGWTNVSPLPYRRDSRSSAVKIAKMEVGRPAKIPVGMGWGPLPFFHLYFSLSSPSR